MDEECVNGVWSIEYHKKYHHQNRSFNTSFHHHSPSQQWCLKHYHNRAGRKTEKEKKKKEERKKRKKKRKKKKRKKEKGWEGRLTVLQWLWGVVSLSLSLVSNQPTASTKHAYIHKRMNSRIDNVFAETSESSHWWGGNPETRLRIKILLFTLLTIRWLTEQIIKKKKEKEKGK